MTYSRPDEGLAFMLRYENIAWYEDGAVRILDRRIYPAEKRFVECKDHREVAKAIKDMVTQSAGPYAAAAMGMVLAAYNCEDKGEKERMDFLREAAHVLSTARPTTTKRMQLVTAAMLKAAESAGELGENLTEAMFNAALDLNNVRYERMDRVGSYLADLLPKRGNIMTQCFGETIVGMMLRKARERDMDLKIYCPETRPYFQGARLTATVVVDMGFDVTVITDNMPAYVMDKVGIDVFTSAADAICVDGHVVNKVGTFQIAIAANYHGIPYFVTGAPDIGHPDAASVKIEERDPEFVLQAMGVRTAAEGVKGFYPSFDITPPHLVCGVVTDRGIFSPYDLERYFATEDNRGEFPKEENMVV